MAHGGIGKGEIMKVPKHIIELLNKASEDMKTKPLVTVNDFIEIFVIAELSLANDISPDRIEEAKKKLKEVWNKYDVFQGYEV